MASSIFEVYSYIILAMQGSELQISRQDFSKLLDSKVLPPKMEAKLKYLQSSIFGRVAESSAFDELADFEKKSFLEMGRDRQVALFTSIVSCLAGRDTLEYFREEKAAMKKDRPLAGWVNCYLTCVGNRLQVYKRRDSLDLLQEFVLDRLWVAKIYRTVKGRFRFSIAYDSLKYDLKFQQEGTCARIHGQLINLIRRKRAASEQVNENKSGLQFERNEVVQEEEDREGDFKQEDYFKEEERNYLLGLRQMVEEEKMDDDSGFQLMKNVANGRMIANKTTGVLKLYLFVEDCRIAQAMESYVHFDCWNLQVDSFKLLNRVRKNTFIAHIKLKRYNVFSSPRQAYVTITYLKSCPCLMDSPVSLQSSRRSQFLDCNLSDQQHFLIIRTITQHSFPYDAGCVRMDFKQIVQFTEMKETSSTIFVSLLSNIKFNGYEYISSNLEMNSYFMNDSAAFISYYRQRAVSNKERGLFDYGYCVCTVKQVGSPLQRENSIPGMEESRVEESSIKSSNRQIRQAVGERQEAQGNVKLVEEYLQDVNNLKLIDWVRARGYESYYLKLRFDQNPREQPYQISQYQLREDRDFLLQGGQWKITNDQYIFCDEAILRSQKGVLKTIIKQITSNIMAGKSVMSMSLPVEISMPCSTLEAVANILGFLPPFMHKAVSTDDVVEQIKYVACCFLFMWACRPSILKPFNPILGETFEATIGGIPIFLEQISHHPPITSFYMKTARFQAYGNFDMHIDLGLNAAYSKIFSPITVKITHTNTEYRIKLPDLEIGGVMFGDRTVKLVGRSFILQRTNNIYLEYSIGKDRKKMYEYPSKLKPSDLAGGIFRVTPACTSKLMNLDRGKSFDGIKSEEIVEKYCQISGKWYGNIYFDGVAYKTVENGPFPVKMERPTALLPSDSMFRTDIIFKRFGNNPKSNEEKEILENNQRKDRKGRDRHRP